MRGEPLDCGCESPTVVGFWADFGDEVLDADFGNIGGGVADAVDVGDDDFVGVVEAGGELVEEFVGAAILVGLEDGENFGFGAVFFAKGFEGRADFGGMMRVVVVKVGVVAEAFVFHAAPSALE